MCVVRAELAGFERRLRDGRKVRFCRYRAPTGDLKYRGVRGAEG